MSGYPLKKNGLGVYAFDNGDFYFGEWENDFIQGEGILFFAFGGFAHGYFERSKLHGPAFLKFSNGEIYEGYWKNGLLDGEAYNYFIDENLWLKCKYSNGKFENLLEEGEGRAPSVILNHLSEMRAISDKHRTPENPRVKVIDLKDGQQFLGTAIKNKPCGLGILRKLDGKCDIGFCDDGRFVDIGRIHFKDGSLYDGLLKGGKFFGRGLYYNTNDKSWLYGHFENGECKRISKQGSGKYPLQIVEQIRAQHHKKSNRFVDQSIAPNIFYVPTGYNKNEKKAKQIQWQPQKIEQMREKTFSDKKSPRLIRSLYVHEQIFHEQDELKRKQNMLKKSQEREITASPNSKLYRHFLQQSQSDQQDENQIKRSASKSDRERDRNTSPNQNQLYPNQLKKRGRQVSPFKVQGSTTNSYQSPFKQGDSKQINQFSSPGSTTAQKKQGQFKGSSSSSTMKPANQPLQQSRVPVDSNSNYINVQDSYDLSYDDMPAIKDERQKKSKMGGAGQKEGDQTRGIQENKFIIIDSQPVQAQNFSSPTFSQQNQNPSAMKPITEEQKQQYLNQMQRALHKRGDEEEPEKRTPSEKKFSELESGSSVGDLTPISSNYTTNQQIINPRSQLDPNTYASQVSDGTANRDQVLFKQGPQQNYRKNTFGEEQNQNKLEQFPFKQPSSNPTYAVSPNQLNQSLSPTLYSTTKEQPFQQEYQTQSSQQLYKSQDDFQSVKNRRPLSQSYHSEAYKPNQLPQDNNQAKSETRISQDLLSPNNTQRVQNNPLRLSQYVANNVEEPIKKLVQKAIQSDDNSEFLQKYRNVLNEEDPKSSFSDYQDMVSARNKIILNKIEQSQIVREEKDVHSHNQEDLISFQTSIIGLQDQYISKSKRSQSLMARFPPAPFASENLHSGIGLGDFQQSQFISTQRTNVDTQRENKFYNQMSQQFTSPSNQAENYQQVKSQNANNMHNRHSSQPNLQRLNLYQTQESTTVQQNNPLLSGKSATSYQNFFGNQNSIQSQASASLIPGQVIVDTLQSVRGPSSNYNQFKDAQFHYQQNSPSIQHTNQSPTTNNEMEFVEQELQQTQSSARIINKSQNQNSEQTMFKRDTSPQTPKKSIIKDISSPRPVVTPKSVRFSQEMSKQQINQQGQQHEQSSTDAQNDKYEELTFQDMMNQQNPQGLQQQQDGSNQNQFGQIANFIQDTPQKVNPQLLRVNVHLQQPSMVSQNSVISNPQQLIRQVESYLSRNSGDDQMLLDPKGKEFIQKLRQNSPESQQILQTFSSLPQEQRQEFIFKAVTRQAESQISYANNEGTGSNSGDSSQKKELYKRQNLQHLHSQASSISDNDIINQNRNQQGGFDQKPPIHPFREAHSAMISPKNEHSQISQQPFSGEQGEEQNNPQTQKGNRRLSPGQEMQQPHQQKKSDFYNNRNVQQPFNQSGSQYSGQQEDYEEQLPIQTSQERNQNYQQSFNPNNQQSQRLQGSFYSPDVQDDQNQPETMQGNFPINKQSFTSLNQTSPGVQNNLSINESGQFSQSNLNYSQSPEQIRQLTSDFQFTTSNNNSFRQSTTSNNQSNIRLIALQQPQDLPEQKVNQFGSSNNQDKNNTSRNQTLPDEICEDFESINIGNFTDRNQERQNQNYQPMLESQTQQSIGDNIRTIIRTSDSQSPERQYTQNRESGQKQQFVQQQGRQSNEIPTSKSIESTRNQQRNQIVNQQQGQQQQPINEQSEDFRVQQKHQNAPANQQRQNQFMQGSRGVNQPFQMSQEFEGQQNQIQNKDPSVNTTEKQIQPDSSSSQIKSSQQMQQQQQNQKRQQQQGAQQLPRNLENLSESQQKQISNADDRLDDDYHEEEHLDQYSQRKSDKQESERQRSVQSPFTQERQQSSQGHTSQQNKDRQIPSSKDQKILSKEKSIQSPYSSDKSQNEIDQQEQEETRYSQHLQRQNQSQDSGKDFRKEALNKSESGQYDNQPKQGAQSIEQLSSTQQQNQRYVQQPQQPQSKNVQQKFPSNQQSENQGSSDEQQSPKQIQKQQPYYQDSTKYNPQQEEQKQVSQKTKNMNQFFDNEGKIIQDQFQNQPQQQPQRQDQQQDTGKVLRKEAFNQQQLNQQDTKQGAQSTEQFPQTQQQNQRYAQQPQQPYSKNVQQKYPSDQQSENQGSSDEQYSPKQIQKQQSYYQDSSDYNPQQEEQKQVSQKTKNMNQLYDNEGNIIQDQFQNQQKLPQQQPQRQDQQVQEEIRQSQHQQRQDQLQDSGKVLRKEAFNQQQSSQYDNQPKQGAQSTEQFPQTQQQNQRQAQQPQQPYSKNVQSKYSSDQQSENQGSSDEQYSPKQIQKQQSYYQDSSDYNPQQEEQKQVSQKTKNMNQLYDNEGNIIQDQFQNQQKLPQQQPQRQDQQVQEEIRQSQHQQRQDQLQDSGKVLRKEAFNQSEQGQHDNQPNQGIQSREQFPQAQGQNQRYAQQPQQPYSKNVQQKYPSNQQYENQGSSDEQLSPKQIQYQQPNYEDSSDYNPQYEEQKQGQQKKTQLYDNEGHIIQDQLENQQKQTQQQPQSQSRKDVSQSRSIIKSGADNQSRLNVGSRDLEDQSNFINQGDLSTPQRENQTHQHEDQQLSPNEYSQSPVKQQTLKKTLPQQQSQEYQQQQQQQEPHQSQERSHYSQSPKKQTSSKKTITSDKQDEDYEEESFDEQNRDLQSQPSIRSAFTNNPINQEKQLHTSSHSLKNEQELQNTSPISQQKSQRPQRQPQQNIQDQYDQSQQGEPQEIYQQRAQNLPYEHSSSQQISQEQKSSDGKKQSQDKQQNQQIERQQIYQQGGQVLPHDDDQEDEEQNISQQQQYQQKKEQYREQQNQPIYQQPYSEEQEDQSSFNEQSPNIKNKISSQNVLNSGKSIEGTSPQRISNKYVSSPLSQHDIRSNQQQTNQSTSQKNLTHSQYQQEEEQDNDNQSYDQQSEQSGLNKSLNQKQIITPTSGRQDQLKSTFSREQNDGSISSPHRIPSQQQQQQRTVLNNQSQQPSSSENLYFDNEGEDQNYQSPISQQKQIVNTAHSQNQFNITQQSPYQQQLNPSNQKLHSPESAQDRSLNVTPQPNYQQKQGTNQNQEDFKQRQISEPFEQHQSGNKTDNQSQDNQYYSAQQGSSSQNQIQQRQSPEKRQGTSQQYYSPRSNQTDDNISSQQNEKQTGRSQQFLDPKQSREDYSQGQLSSPQKSDLSPQQISQISDQNRSRYTDQPTEAYKQQVFNRSPISIEEDIQNQDSPNKDKQRQQQLQQSQRSYKSNDPEQQLQESSSSPVQKSQMSEKSSRFQNNQNDSPFNQNQSLNNQNVRLVGSAESVEQQQRQNVSPVTQEKDLTYSNDPNFEKQGQQFYSQRSHRSNDNEDNLRQYSESPTQQQQNKQYSSSEVRNKDITQDNLYSQQSVSPSNQQYKSSPLRQEYVSDNFNQDNRQIQTMGSLNRSPISLQQVSDQPNRTEQDQQFNSQRGNQSFEKSQQYTDSPSRQQQYQSNQNVNLSPSQEDNDRIKNQQFRSSQSGYDDKSPERKGQEKGQQQGSQRGDQSFERNQQYADSPSKQQPYYQEQSVNLSPSQEQSDKIKNQQFRSSQSPERKSHNEQSMQQEKYLPNQREFQSARSKEQDQLSEKSPISNKNMSQEGNQQFRQDQGVLSGSQGQRQDIKDQYSSNDTDQPVSTYTQGQQVMQNDPAHKFNKNIKTEQSPQLERQQLKDEAYYSQKSIGSQSDQKQNMSPFRSERQQTSSEQQQFLSPEQQQFRDQPYSSSSQETPIQSQEQINQRVINQPDQGFKSNQIAQNIQNQSPTHQRVQQNLEEEEISNLRLSSKNLPYSSERQPSELQQQLTTPQKQAGIEGNFVQGQFPSQSSVNQNEKGKSPTIDQQRKQQEVAEGNQTQIYQQQPQTQHQQQLDYQRDNRLPGSSDQDDQIVRSSHQVNTPKSNQQQDLQYQSSSSPLRRQPQNEDQHPNQQIQGSQHLSNQAENPSLRQSQQESQQQKYISPSQEKGGVVNDFQSQEFYNQQPQYQSVDKSNQNISSFNSPASQNQQFGNNQQIQKSLSKDISPQQKQIQSPYSEQQSEPFRQSQQDASNKKYPSSPFQTQSSQIQQSQSKQLSPEQQISQRPFQGEQSQSQYSSVSPIKSSLQREGSDSTSPIRQQIDSQYKEKKNNFQEGEKQYSSYSPNQQKQEEVYSQQNREDDQTTYYRESGSKQLNKSQEQNQQSQLISPYQSQVLNQQNAQSPLQKREAALQQVSILQQQLHRGSSIKQRDSTSPIRTQGSSSIAQQIDPSIEGNASKYLDDKDYSSVVIRQDIQPVPLQESIKKAQEEFIKSPQKTSYYKKAGSLKSPSYSPSISPNIRGSTTPQSSLIQQQQNNQAFTFEQQPISSSNIYSQFKSDKPSEQRQINPSELVPNPFVNVQSPIQLVTNLNKNMGFSAQRSDDGFYPSPIKQRSGSSSQYIQNKDSANLISNIAQSIDYQNKQHPFTHQTSLNQQFNPSNIYSSQRSATSEIGYPSNKNVPYSARDNYQRIDQQGSSHKKQPSQHYSSGYIPSADNSNTNQRVSPIDQGSSNKVYYQSLSPNQSRYSSQIIQQQITSLRQSRGNSGTTTPTKQEQFKEQFEIVSPKEQDLRQQSQRYGFNSRKSSESNAQQNILPKQGFISPVSISRRQSYKSLNEQQISDPNNRIGQSFNNSSQQFQSQNTNNSQQDPRFQTTYNNSYTNIPTVAYKSLSDSKQIQQGQRKFSNPILQTEEITRPFISNLPPYLQSPSQSQTNISQSYLPQQSQQQQQQQQSHHRRISSDKYISGTGSRRQSQGQLSSSQNQLVIPPYATDIDYNVQSSKRPPSFANSGRTSPSGEQYNVKAKNNTFSDQRLSHDTNFRNYGSSNQQANQQQQLQPSYSMTTKSRISPNISGIFSNPDKSIIDHHPELHQGGQMHQQSNQSSFQPILSPISVSQGNFTGQKMYQNNPSSQQTLNITSPLFMDQQNQGEEYQKRNQPFFQSQRIRNQDQYSPAQYQTQDIYDSNVNKSDSQRNIPSSQQNKVREPYSAESHELFRSQPYTGYQSESGNDKIQYYGYQGDSNRTSKDKQNYSSQNYLRNEQQDQIPFNYSVQDRESIDRSIHPNSQNTIKSSIIKSPFEDEKLNKQNLRSSGYQQERQDIQPQQTSSRQLIKNQTSQQEYLPESNVQSDYQSKQSSSSQYQGYYIPKTSELKINDSMNEKSIEQTSRYSQEDILENQNIRRTSPSKFGGEKEYQSVPSQFGQSPSIEQHSQERPIYSSLRNESSPLNKQYQIADKKSNTPYFEAQQFSDKPISQQQHNEGYQPNRQMSVDQSEEKDKTKQSKIPTKLGSNEISSSRNYDKPEQIYSNNLQIGDQQLSSRIPNMNQSYQDQMRNQNKDNQQTVYNPLPDNKQKDTNNQISGQYLSQPNQGGEVAQKQQYYSQSSNQDQQEVQQELNQNQRYTSDSTQSKPISQNYPYTSESQKYNPSISHDDITKSREQTKFVQYPTHASMPAEQQSRSEQSYLNPNDQADSYNKQENKNLRQQDPSSRYLSSNSPSSYTDKRKEQQDIDSSNIQSTFAQLPQKNPLQQEMIKQQEPYRSDEQKSSYKNNELSYIDQPVQREQNPIIPTDSNKSTFNYNYQQSIPQSGYDSNTSQSGISPNYQKGIPSESNQQPQFKNEQVQSYPQRYAAGDNKNQLSSQPDKEFKSEFDHQQFISKEKEISDKKSSLPESVGKQYGDNASTQIPFNQPNIREQQIRENQQQVSQNVQNQYIPQLNQLGSNYGQIPQQQLQDNISSNLGRVVDNKTSDNRYPISAASTLQDQRKEQQKDMSNPIYDNQQPFSNQYNKTSSNQIEPQEQYQFKQTSPSYQSNSIFEKQQQKDDTLKQYQHQHSGDLSNVRQQPINEPFNYQNQILSNEQPSQKSQVQPKSTEQIQGQTLFPSNESSSRDPNQLKEKKQQDYEQPSSLLNNQRQQQSSQQPTSNQQQDKLLSTKQYLPYQNEIKQYDDQIKSKQGLPSNQVSSDVVNQIQGNYNDNSFNQSLRNDNLLSSQDPLKRAPINQESNQQPSYQGQFMPQESDKVLSQQPFQSYSTSSREPNQVNEMSKYINEQPSSFLSDQKQQSQLPTSKQLQDKLLSTNQYQPYSSQLTKQNEEEIKSRQGLPSYQTSSNTDNQVQDNYIDKQSNLISSQDPLKRSSLNKEVKEQPLYQGQSMPQEAGNIKSQQPFQSYQASSSSRDPNSYKDIKQEDYRLPQTSFNNQKYQEKSILPVSNQQQDNVLSSNYYLPSPSQNEIKQSLDNQNQQKQILPTNQRQSNFDGYNQGQLYKDNQNPVSDNQILSSDPLKRGAFNQERELKDKASTQPERSYDYNLKTDQKIGDNNYGSTNKEFNKQYLPSSVQQSNDQLKSSQNKPYLPNTTDEQGQVVYRRGEEVNQKEPTSNYSIPQSYQKFPSENEKNSQANTNMYDTKKDVLIEDSFGAPKRQNDQSLASYQSSPPKQQASVNLSQEYNSGNQHSSLIPLNSEDAKNREIYKKSQMPFDQSVEYYSANSVNLQPSIQTQEVSNDKRSISSPQKAQSFQSYQSQRQQSVPHDNIANKYENQYGSVAFNSGASEFDSLKKQEEKYDERKRPDQLQRQQEPTIYLPQDGQRSDQNFQSSQQPKMYNSSSSQSNNKYTPMLTAQFNNSSFDELSESQRKADLRFNSEQSANQLGARGKSPLITHNQDSSYQLTDREPISISKIPYQGSISSSSQRNLDDIQRDSQQELNKQKELSSQKPGYYTSERSQESPYQPNYQSRTDNVSFDNRSLNQQNPLDDTYRTYSQAGGRDQQQTSSLFNPMSATKDKLNNNTSQQWQSNNASNYQTYQSPQDNLSQSNVQGQSEQANFLSKPNKKANQLFSNMQQFPQQQSSSYLVKGFEDNQPISSQYKQPTQFINDRQQNPNADKSTKDSYVVQKIRAVDIQKDDESGQLTSPLPKQIPEQYLSPKDAYSSINNDDEVNYRTILSHASVGGQGQTSAQRQQQSQRINDGVQNQSFNDSLGKINPNQMNSSFGNRQNRDTTGQNNPIKERIDNIKNIESKIKFLSQSIMSAVNESQQQIKPNELSYESVVEEIQEYAPGNQDTNILPKAGQDQREAYKRSRYNQKQPIQNETPQQKGYQRGNVQEAERGINYDEEKKSYRQSPISQIYGHSDNSTTYIPFNSPNDISPLSFPYDSHYLSQHPNQSSIHLSQMQNHPNANSQVQTANRTYSQPHRMNQPQQQQYLPNQPGVQQQQRQNAQAQNIPQQNISHIYSPIKLQQSVSASPYRQQVIIRTPVTYNQNQSSPIQSQQQYIQSQVMIPGQNRQSIVVSQTTSPYSHNQKKSLSPIKSNISIGSHPSNNTPIKPIQKEIIYRTHSPVIIQDHQQRTTSANRVATDVLNMSANNMNQSFISQVVSPMRNQGFNESVMMRQSQGVNMSQSIISPVPGTNKHIIISPIRDNYLQSSLNLSKQFAQSPSINPLNQSYGNSPQISKTPLEFIKFYTPQKNNMFRSERLNTASPEKRNIKEIERPNQKPSRRTFLSCCKNDFADEGEIEVEPSRGNLLTLQQLKQQQSQQQNQTDQDNSNCNIF